MTEILCFPIFYKRFNRYMVECEYKQLRFAQKINDGFNRYMVECEYIIGLISMTKNICFNRYMVECEYRSGWM